MAKYHSKEATIERLRTAVAYLVVTVQPDRQTDVNCVGFRYGDEEASE